MCECTEVFMDTILNCRHVTINMSTLCGFYGQCYAVAKCVVSPCPYVAGTESKISCNQCGEWLHKRSMARHIERKHSKPTSVQCDMCDKAFSSLVNLKEHYRQFHGMSTRDKF